MLNTQGQNARVAGARGLAGYMERKTVTFNGQTAGTINLFSCQGANVVRIVCVCTATVTVTDTPTVEVGIAVASAAIIAQTAASLLAQDEIWHDNSPDAKIEALSTMRDFIIAGSNTIILTIGGVTSVDTGALEFYCLWAPLSEDGLVTPA